MNSGWYFGPNKNYGISLTLFEVDDIHFELGTTGQPGERRDFGYSRQSGVVELLLVGVLGVAQVLK
jgi:hypothetical protein